MAIEIKMPPLSQTTDTVTLVDWLVQEGDTIEKGQPIADVETDKVTMQIESFTAGTVVKLISVSGDDIPVGDIIAYIGEAGEEVPEKETETAASGSSGPPQPQQNTDRMKPASAPTPASAGVPAQAGIAIKATPLVVNFAAKKGIDLSHVTGTGPKGLIVKADVERFLETGGKEPTVPDAANAPSAAEYTASVQFDPPADLGSYTTSRMQRNQKAVAMNLTRSVQEIPHYFVKSTIYMDRALRWRGNSRNAAGEKISVYSMYVYAAAKALQSYPSINGFFMNNNHCIYRNINVAFAVATGTDLFVPVVRQADKKSILEIDKEVKWLTAKARNEKLQAEDIANATFTISNLGIYQIDDFSAIISPGQAGIIAIGRTKKMVTVDDDDRIQIRQGVVLSGSFDHRIVNGALGAAFTQRMKEILEKESGS